MRKPIRDHGWRGVIWIKLNRIIIKLSTPAAIINYTTLTIYIERQSFGTKDDINMTQAEALVEHASKLGVSLPSKYRL